jgi:pimeloyl-ACP methyl ester carboxylesterase
MIDRGRGQPIVMVPGMQGRWEWMEPAIDALAKRFRVLSFSLGERAARNKPGVPARGSNPGFQLGVHRFFDDQVDAVIDHAGVDRAVILGVSFGGLIAAHYAARRPDRSAALILVSAPSPRWRPNVTQARALRHPWLSYPVLVPAWIARLMPELAAARPAWGPRLRFIGEYAVRAVRAPLVPGRVAGWINEWMAIDITTDCARITAPTLVITGEPHLDRVVPPASTREYLDLIPHARYVLFANTGHVGLVSRPIEFARIVGDFIGNSLPAVAPAAKNY